MFLSVNLICKMISKTKIGKRIHDKKNPFLVETLIACKKNGNENWMTIARFLSVPTQKRNGRKFSYSWKGFKPRRNLKR